MIELLLFFDDDCLVIFDGDDVGFWSGELFFVEGSFSDKDTNFRGFVL